MPRCITWRNKCIPIPALADIALGSEYGRAWYRESGESIERYAASIGTTPKRVADVVAILSPRVSVNMNVRLARSYLTTGKAPGAMKARLHALAVYDSSGVFTGPKVTAFSRALQGDGDAIVIDAWIFRLFALPSTAKGHSVACGLVAETAGQLGWRPAETQAALWCGTRELVGYKSSYSPLLMEGVR